MHLDVYILPVALSMSIALVLEIETLTVTILNAQTKERFVIGARGGHVDCRKKMRDSVGYINALVEDSLKKCTEVHHGFVRIEPDTT